MRAGGLPEKDRSRTQSVSVSLERPSVKGSRCYLVGLMESTAELEKSPAAARSANDSAGAKDYEELQLAYKEMQETAKQCTLVASCD